MSQVQTLRRGRSRCLRASFQRKPCIFVFQAACEDALETDLTKATRQGKRLCDCSVAFESFEYHTLHMDAPGPLRWLHPGCIDGAWLSWLVRESSPRCACRKSTYFRVELRPADSASDNNPQIVFRAQNAIVVSD
jgi:hypothetical protein